MSCNYVQCRAISFNCDQLCATMYCCCQSSRSWIFKISLDFTNWAWYRPGMGKYEPEDIDPTICTHVVYAFVALDSVNLIMTPTDKFVDQTFYQKITALKANLSLKGCFRKSEYTLF